MRAKKQPRLTSYLYMLINVLTWGAFLPIVKFGFEGSDISPFRYLFYRFALASLLSLPFIFYYWHTVRDVWKSIGTIIAIEVLGTSLALGLLYTGLRQTSSLDANLIASTLPIWITIGGIVFLREKESKREWVGLALATLGTLFLVIEPLLNGMLGDSGTFGGNIFIIGHNIATTAYFLLAKKHYKSIPKLFVSSISFILGFVTFLVASLMESGGNLGLIASVELTSPLILVVVLYAAVFGSIIGLTAYIKGQDGIEASEASLFSYLQPLVFIPLGYILLQEKATLLQLVALGFVVAGVFVAEQKTHFTLLNAKRAK